MKSAIEMLKTFASEVVKYAEAGAPHVTKVEYQKRIEACKDCPHLRVKVDRCGLCGCLVEHKAKWATAACPDDPKRWSPVYIGKQGRKVTLKGKNRDGKSQHEESDTANSD